MPVCKGCSRTIPHNGLCNARGCVESTRTAADKWARVAERICPIQPFNMADYLHKQLSTYHDAYSKQVKEAFNI